MAMIKVDRRLYTDASGKKLVEADDPKRAFLWAAKGQEVLDKEAERVGYKPKSGDGTKKDAPAANKKAAPAENKGK